jgi:uncharacterized membrane protein YkvA (DUF1232 family)
MDEQIVITEESMDQDSEELQPSNKAKAIGYVLLAIFCIIYLINPTGGFIEAIPDNLPIVGNLDEAGVTALLLMAIDKLRRGDY